MFFASTGQRSFLRGLPEVSSALLFCVSLQQGRVGDTPLQLPTQPLPQDLIFFFYCSKLTFWFLDVGRDDGSFGGAAKTVSDFEQGRSPGLCLPKLPSLWT